MTGWQTHWTFPGHEPDMDARIRDVAWDVRKFAEMAPVIGSINPDDPAVRDAVLATTLKQARRLGIPASSAWFDGDCIVVAVARPRGVG